jgi:hypothetical protein
MPNVPGREGVRMQLGLLVNEPVTGNFRCSASESYGT